MMKKIALAILLIGCGIYMAGCAGQGEPIGTLLECCITAPKVVAYYSQEPPSGADPGLYLRNWSEWRPYGRRCVGYPDVPTEGKYIECLPIYDWKDPVEVCGARQMLGIPLKAPVYDQEGNQVESPCR